jgi:hypothetical protein
MPSADLTGTFSLEPPCEVKLVLSPNSRLRSNSTTKVVSYKERGGEGRIDVKVTSME